MVVNKQAVLAQQGWLCHLCSAAIGPDTPADVLIFWEKDPLTRDYDPVPIIFCRAHTTEEVLVEFDEDDAATRKSIETTVTYTVKLA